jgi:hypothetical protein
MDPPPIRYIERDGRRLAYQVVGSGPSDVVWLLECMNHLDLLWTDPHLNHLFERASAYSQILLVQRRGFGVSDPIDHVPSLEQQLLGRSSADQRRAWTICTHVLTVASSSTSMPRSLPRTARRSRWQPMAF